MLTVLYLTKGLEQIEIVMAVADCYEIKWNLFF